jgi:hypothetical protein
MDHFLCPCPDLDHGLCPDLWDDLYPSLDLCRWDGLCLWADLDQSHRSVALTFSPDPDPDPDLDFCFSSVLDFGFSSFSLLLMELHGFHDAQNFLLLQVLLLSLLLFVSPLVHSAPPPCRLTALESYSEVLIQETLYHEHFLELSPQAMLPLLVSPLVE